MIYLKFFIYILSAMISFPIFSQEWEPPPEWHLPAFEKIYVTPYDILSTPQGTFYINSKGEKEKVRAVRSDWGGTYVIKYKQECPVCGRWYDDYTVQDGFDCPLSQTEVMPHIWHK